MTLAADWTALIARRPAFRDTLAPFGRVIEAWASVAEDAIAPLGCSSEQARASWLRGEPLLAQASPPLDRGRIEALLGPALDVVDMVEDARPFANAWDSGEIAPADLLPRGGCLAADHVHERSRLSQSAVAFLAVAGLRPSLTAYMARCHALIDRFWDRGDCPCCGAPAGFADLLEDGRRELACHVCDARWTIGRLVCPLCGSREAQDMARSIVDGADEGYALAACRACRGYVKELDRRARWNAGPALVEDWGTPHLDLIASRKGYWRPIPSLIQLAGVAAGDDSGARDARHGRED